ncbi:MAG: helicase [Actinomycetia bacterium]|nr:helicase [Actinomycetes bacterium]
MTGLAARDIVEAAVRRELFGPSGEEAPRGKPVDCAGGALHFESAEESRGQFHDAGTLQEILTHSDPLRRYGIGVLYGGAEVRGSRLPGGTPRPGESEIAGLTGIGESDEEITAEQPRIPEKIQESSRFDDADPDDFDLTDANSFKPSAMAVSFQCRVPAGGSLLVSVQGAHYDRIATHATGLGKPQEWWVRRPFELTGDVPGHALLDEVGRLKVVRTAPVANKPRIAPATRVFSRPVPGEADPSLRLVTIAIVNETAGTGPANALFQMGFRVTARGGLTIDPYPEADQSSHDEEEQSIDLLYRNRRTYAIGHGCAADWGEAKGGTVDWVRSDPLPAYEVTGLTPDMYVPNADGTRTPVTVSMQALASGATEGQRQVETVLRLYAEWIDEQEQSVPGLPSRFEAAATRHLALCREALQRMRDGWDLVQADALANRAFRLANEAMLYQQLRSQFPLRPVERDKYGVYHPVGPHPEPVATPGRGNWRPFQIAFLLATLPELVNPRHRSRSLVDLIFFPTGGGKTEAYLGAAAISLLARRLRDPADAGTDVIMRYTLRLLTAQQFLRAAALACVLEDIRSKNEAELGSDPFGIGVWLGGETTPNSWKSAQSSLHELQSQSGARNQFLLLRCPWCGTEMGPKPRKGKGQDPVGYQLAGDRVVLRCPDGRCRFGGKTKKLPVHVVDEGIYEERPSIIIGTVDKFAMLAWRPEAHRLFGLGADGEREVSPPGLIVQDELHLISGPLGSMVGLYETIIDELCTDRRGSGPVPPKIIAATATIRRFKEQVRSLYARDEVRLFPPHGLEEGHSFFAEPATLKDGVPAPGRRYVGVMSASLGSLQTVQVRVAAATLQAGNEVPEEDRDGYWTNLNFLNSLRELGNTVSLLQSDVPDYLTGLRRRDGIDPRWPRTIMELTSRRRSDEIPRAIEQLQASYGTSGCTDICLASNIIEVGIDIDRLGLMTIVGQPKTTAQYIQVSGRVGRRPDRNPGLVLTLYGAAKPRDRSHYERFRTYHERLYAQVEPTSVTPFATPVLRRALHATAVVHIRQEQPAAAVYPFPRDEWDRAVTLLRDRAMAVDPDEVSVLDRLANSLAQQWDKWERTKWSANAFDGDPVQGLMRFAGTLPSLDSKAMTWDVPSSMRNVDAECQLEISLAYNQADGAAGEGNL